MEPMALRTSSTVLAPILRRWALSVAKAISMGFGSGE
jgi:hypothetical protein